MDEIEAFITAAVKAGLTELLIPAYEDEFISNFHKYVAAKYTELGIGIANSDEDELWDVYDFEGFKIFIEKVPE